jgi:hypothetical protein
LKHDSEAEFYRIIANGSLGGLVGVGAALLLLRPWRALAASGLNTGDESE